MSLSRKGKGVPYGSTAVGILCAAAKPFELQVASTLPYAAIDTPCHSLASVFISQDTICCCVQLAQLQHQSWALLAQKDDAAFYSCFVVPLRQRLGYENMRALQPAVVRWPIC